MIKLIKIIAIILFILLIDGNLSFAQSSSAYSRIGIGDLEYSYSARRLGMGHLGTSVADADFVGTLNPASLYTLRRTRLETGVSYNGLFLKNNSTSNYYAETEFSGFTFAFPLSVDNGAGFAVGIVPYSNVSYNVVENVTAGLPEGDEYKIFYEGKGGISKIFLAASYRLPFNLVLGYSFDYYFGNLNYISRSKFTDPNNLEAEYKRTYTATGLGSTFGLISPDISGLFNSSGITDFHLGASASFMSDLNTDTILTSTTSLVTDTIGTSGKTTISIPTRISAGLSLVLSGKYLVCLDYTFQPWSKYTYAGKTSSNLRDAMKLAAGFEYRNPREPGTTFWELIIWRAGFGYEETQYQVNGTGINQLSVSGGFSLPLSYDNTLDIGLEFAMRGTTDNNLYKENIVKFNVGVSLGEVWFIRSEK